MPYIYEHPNWPDFYWELPILTPKLSKLRLQQGRLLGRVAALGLTAPQWIDEAEVSLRTITQDVIKSSEIEGEHLPMHQVRSSLARRLGLPIGEQVATGPKVEGMANMLLDAIQNYMAPLTVTRLWSWHRALFPTGRNILGSLQIATWRDGPMQVVSGPMGKQIVHFEAPSPTRITAEMERFLSWFNTENHIDPLLKAGIAQLWFLTIHPLEDGNGRIARALTDMLLARSEGSTQRFYSMSKRIQEERSVYYQLLESTQRGTMDITTWLQWFIECLERAINDAENTIDNILEKATFWIKHQQTPLNERQRRVLHRLLEGFEGKLTSSKYAAMTHISQDTATRDLDELVRYGILERHSGGRSTHYMVPKKDDSGAWGAFGDRGSP